VGVPSPCACGPRFYGNETSIDALGQALSWSARLNVRQQDLQLVGLESRTQPSS